MSDVKEIYQIKDIEKYLDEYFGFVLYEKGDNVQIYELWIDQDIRIIIEIISDESLIDHEYLLQDLITQDNIYFLNWSVWDTLYDEELYSCSYRPLIDDSEKDFDL